MVMPVTVPGLFTDADLGKINDAIVQGIGGPVKVRFADGREVTYRGMDELLNARRLVQESLRQSRRSGGLFARSTRATYVRD